MGVELLLLLAGCRVELGPPVAQAGAPQQAAVLAMIVVAAVLVGGPLMSGRPRWA